MTRIDGLGYPIIVETGALARLGALALEQAPAHRYAIVSDADLREATAKLAGTITGTVATTGPRARGIK